MAVRIDGASFENEVLKSDKLVITDFYSDSCIPCKRMSPLLAEIEKENENALKVAKLNINFDAETAEKYNVTSVPTLVFFKDGKEITRLTGAVKKPEIIEAINNI